MQSSDGALAVKQAIARRKLQEVGHGHVREKERERNSMFMHWVAIAAYVYIGPFSLFCSSMC
jgi:hypothetical protein